MKNLILLNDNTEVKLGDTGTKIRFKATDNGTLVALKDGQNATFRIKNNIGFLKSINADTIYNGYGFEFDTSSLSDLVAGAYQVELVVAQSSDDVLIFPDEGYVQFKITDNALSITGEQLPQMSLEAFKNEVNNYVSTKVSEASTEITNNFQKYVDGITDSTTTVANKASQDAATATSTANSAVSVASEAKTTATAASALANGASIMATSAVDSIDSGLYLDLAKSFTQANTSHNLVVNSDMQTNVDGVNPYQDWEPAWGWVYTNGVSIFRKNWYGHEALKANAITNSVALLSQSVCAGNPKGATTYSAKVHYRNYGDLTNTTYTFALEYAYQSDFQNSQKITLGTVNKDSSTDDWIVKEAINVPRGYNWIRLRVEADTAKPEAYLFIGSPMINYGSTALDYVSSNQPGQRIADIETVVGAFPKQVSALTMQLAQSNVPNGVNGSIDFNDYKTNGKYSFFENSSTNAPAGVGTVTGILEVTAGGGNGVQRFFDTLADVMFWRTWNGRNFNKWHAVANDPSIISPS